MTGYNDVKLNLQALKANSYSQIKDFDKPKKIESIGGFFSSAMRSFRFICCEKENIVFAILQWLVVCLAYFIWTQGLDIIPEELWEDVSNDDNEDGQAVVSIILFVWSFVCVGLASYPLGLLTACMSSSFLLRFQGRQSTVADCLKITLHNSWTLWIFSWIDGWWTVDRILERLPKKNDRTPRSVKIVNEVTYQAWKLSSLCFIPAILSGRDTINACKDSLLVVKNRFFDLAKLRLGYSLICWIIGIACYVGIIFALPFISQHMNSGNDMYGFYYYAGFPLILALGIIMLIFRPLYIISACRTYAMYSRDANIKIDLPQSTPHFISSLLTFVILGALLCGACFYKEELGITQIINMYLLEK